MKRKQVVSFLGLFYFPFIQDKISDESTDGTTTVFMDLLYIISKYGAISSADFERTLQGKICSFV